MCMALTLRGMPLRTALAATFIDRLARKPVSQLSLTEIQESRRATFPRNRVTDHIFGQVPDTVDISTRYAPARDGYELPLRIYRPRNAAERLPVVMFFHGGGWVLGNVVNYDPICGFISDEVGAVVVSVDYRMAPEFRAPTAAYDCIDAAAWVVERADELGTDGDRLAVCGDSAGGNLSAVVAQVFRDRGRSSIRHQCLIYPATDLTMSSPSVTEHANGAILTKQSMDAFIDHYVPDPDGRTDPIVSPLFGDLRDLPPALIQTADLDLIRDDGIRYADALREAGVEARHTNYLGVPHGFASVPGATVIGEQHRAEIAAELTRHLHPRSGG